MVAMNARKPSSRPGSPRPGRGRRTPAGGRAEPREQTEAGGHAGPGRQPRSSRPGRVERTGETGRRAGPAAPQEPAERRRPGKKLLGRERAVSGGQPAGDGRGASPSERHGTRAGSRRKENRRPRTARRRFSTRRAVVVDAAGGPKHISLRLMSIVLFAVIAVIVVTPTLSNYLDKQRELRDVKARLGSVQQHNKDLQRELDLWKNDDYVRSQARERLGYVLPGQTLHVVTDSSKGTAQEQLERKVASVDRDKRAATPWYSTMWDSVKVAGQSGKAGGGSDKAPIVRETANGR